MKKILYITIITLLIFLGILIYARFFGTTGLKTNEITYKTKSINKSYDGLKIVHLSDIHYKKVITEKRVKQLIKEIKRIKPDIVLFTGDLLDKEYKTTNKDIKFLIKELSKIETTYGKYGIIGDNDYLQADTLKNIYIQSNFTILNNDYTIIKNDNNDNLFIGGLNSSTYEEADIDKVMSYFKNQNEDIFKIILTHEPDYIDEILKTNKPNLILSSHSINGSINIPLLKRAFLPKNAKKYYKPHYKINETDIYISNGIGVNNINFRIFNKPSLNFYRIKLEK